MSFSRSMTVPLVLRKGKNRPDSQNFGTLNYTRQCIQNQSYKYKHLTVSACTDLFLPNLIPSTTRVYKTNLTFILVWNWTTEEKKRNKSWNNEIPWMKYISNLFGFQCFSIFFPIFSLSLHLYHGLKGSFMCFWGVGRIFLIPKLRSIDWLR